MSHICGMINRKIYYVYTHTRLDKNEVFYVGYSYTYEHGKKYKRANEKYKGRRTTYWDNVYNKCGKNIRVDIVFETFSQNEAFNKEKELIELYGRKLYSDGTLVNISDGGENAHTPPQPIMQYNSKGEFIRVWAGGVPEASSYYDCHIAAIHNAIKFKSLSCGYLWRWYFKDTNIYDIIETPPISKNIKTIYQFTKEGDFIKSYPSMSEAGRALNIDRASINNCALGKRVSAGGFKWSFQPQLKKSTQLIRSISQYSLDGELLNVYESLEQIKKLFNISSSTAIRNCFSGKQKQAYGYKWVDCWQMGKR